MIKTIKQINPAELDLTDRPSVEQLLKNSELRYRRLFETAQDGILILDAKTGAITDVNPYLIDMLGYSREEFIEKKLWQVGAFKDVQASKDAFEALQRNQYIRYENLPLKAKGGRLIQVEFVSNVYWVGDGKVIQCNIRDITERRQADERTQRESGERFRSLIENASDLVLLLNPDYTIAYVSPSVERILGYTVAAVVGARIIDFVDPQDLSDFVAATEHRARTPGHSPLLMQVRARRADGSWRTLEGTGSNLLDQPGVNGLVINAHDITDRNRAEEERETTLHQLGERVKELGALHRAARIFQDPQKTTSEVLQGIVSILPAAWQYPDISAARVTYGGAEFATPNYSDTLWKQSAAFATQDGKQGAIEVVYSEGRPNEVEGPFLAEERNLINTLAYDLTVFLERKRAEDALAEERKLLSTFIDSIPDAIYFKDAESRFIRINQTQARQFGLSDPAQAVGKTDFDFFTEEHARPAYEDEQAIMRSGQPLVGKEEKETWPSGQAGWVFTTKMPLRDQAGRIVGTFGISRNITERKRAEDALAQERNLLRTLIDNLPDNVYIKDAESRYVVNNPAHLRSLGATRQEDVLGKTAFDFFPQPRAAQYYAEEQEIIRSGQPMIEQEDPSVDSVTGQQVWLLAKKVPIRDSQGKVVGIVGVSRDITERKRAEDAMRESEMRFSTVFRSSPIGISITRLADGRVSDVNPTFLRMFGYTREEVIGRTTLELNLWAHPEDRDRIFKLLSEQGKVRDLEIQFRKKSGEIGDLLASAELIDLEGERLSLSLMHDITERNRGEEEIKIQLIELQRWHDATLGRETRVLDLKREVNELLGKGGQPSRYPSAET